MTDIAEITITKVSNGWTVKWIGDGGTDEAIARDVDELCEVLCDVLGGYAPMGLMLVGAPPADEPAAKTGGPISVGERFDCVDCCGAKGEWSGCAVRSGVADDCPFEPAVPGTQAQ